MLYWINRNKNIFYIVKGWMKDLFVRMEKLPPTKVGHWDWEHVELAREVIALCRPKSILEIGFNVGHSALIWLSISDAGLTSIDAGALPHTSEGVRQVESYFSGRFSFIQADSRAVKERVQGCSFDLIFVDGGHGYGVCLNDLMLAYQLEIPYILIDDIHYGRVGEAVSDFMTGKPYSLIKQWNIKNGVALYQRK